MFTRVLCLVFMPVLAFAAGLTPAQQAFVDASLLHLYGSAGAIPLEVRVMWEEAVESGVVDASGNPLGVDDGSEPNMSPQSCAALKNSIIQKGNECKQIRDSLEACLQSVPPTADPDVWCLAQTDARDECDDDYWAMSDDYRKYCGD